MKTLSLVAPLVYFALIVFVPLNASQLFAQSEASRFSPSLQNAGLDQSAPGSKNAPSGWVFHGQNGASVELDSDSPFAGNAAARIDTRQLISGEGPTFTNLMQVLDATSYQGKKVSYRAAVKTASLADDARVQMWLRVDRKSAAGSPPIPGAFDNMQDRPIRNGGWQHYEIVLPVAEDAERLAVGIFVIGKGQAWFDDAQLEAVDDDTPSTDMKLDQAVASRVQLPPAVARAIAAADQAPRQPFFSHWLWLALVALLLSFIGMLPPRTHSELPRFQSGVVHRTAFRFAALYWGMYCFQNLVGSLIPYFGRPIVAAYSQMNMRLVEWMARDVFQLNRELVPPNGSGDTTYNYLALLAMFVIALGGTAVWSLIDWRKTDYSGMRDLLRSYLRYTLAFSMMGYGLAKVTFEMNQFPEISSYQLEKSWGNSSPMNVLWSFMGASRPYTIFAGVGEVLAAVLLIWRRTAVLGAAVAFGVMTNVMMLNYCYDVPVKIYSTHLVVMSIMVMLPDVRRLLNLFVLNRLAEAANLRGIWQGRALWWMHATAKTAIVAGLFLFPLSMHTWNVSRQLQRRIAAAQAREENRSNYLLTNRGFRWINEIPFNR